MPRKLRKSKRKQTLSDAWIVWATDGDLPLDHPDHDAWVAFEYFQTADELRSLWAADGERAIRAWIAKNGPGTRPGNYWSYALPYAGERRFGAPLASPFLEGETEAAYLKRHGLLLRGERV